MKFTAEIGREVVYALNGQHRTEGSREMVRRLMEGRTKLEEKLAKMEDSMEDETDVDTQATMEEYRAKIAHLTEQVLEAGMWQVALLDAGK